MGAVAESTKLPLTPCRTLHAWPFLSNHFKTTHIIHFDSPGLLVRRAFGEISNLVGPFNSKVGISKDKVQGHVFLL